MKQTTVKIKGKKPTVKKPAVKRVLNSKYRTYPGAVGLGRIKK